MFCLRCLDRNLRYCLLMNSKFTSQKLCLCCGSWASGVQQLSWPECNGQKYYYINVENWKKNNIKLVITKEKTCHTIRARQDKNTGETIVYNVYDYLIKHVGTTVQLPIEPKRCKNAWNFMKLLLFIMAPTFSFLWSLRLIHLQINKILYMYWCIVYISLEPWINHQMVLYHWKMDSAKKNDSKVINKKQTY